jgi:hypothetical protein
MIVVRAYDLKHFRKVMLIYVGGYKHAACLRLSTKNLHAPFFITQTCIEWLEDVSQKLVFAVAHELTEA